MVSVAGLAIIGYFCWWAVHNCKISRVDLQAMIDEEGISFIVPEPCARSNFLKAVREVASANKKRFMIRKIYKHAEEYCFGLVDESISETAKSLDYAHTATMVFNPLTGTLACDFQHAAFDEIKKLFEEYQNTLTSQDVRNMVIGILSTAHVVGVRQRGGIYFVASKFQDLVEKLSNLLSKLPGECELAVAPQVDVESTKKAIYKAFIVGLKEKIATFQTELTSDMRKSTLANRLDEFKQLREEISFYSDALSFQAQDLDASLQELAQSVQAKLEE